MNKTISLGHAFAHCSSTFSYWFFIVIGFVLVIAAFIFAAKIKTWEDAPRWYLRAGAIALLIIFIFFRPVEVKQNTTEEQAARGIYIGY